MKDVRHAVLAIALAFVVGTSAGQAVQDGGSAERIIEVAKSYLDVRYKAGGSDEDGFDCSGFTRHVYSRARGLLLPRRAEDQANEARLLPIGRAELHPGDLVFFTTLERTYSHVGIYVGNGQFIHAPSSGGKVRIDDLGQAYWDQRFSGGRRAG